MSTADKPPPPEQRAALILALLIGVIAGVYIILGRCVYQWYQIYVELFSP